MKDTLLILKTLGPIIKIFSFFNFVPALVAIISALYFLDLREIYFSLVFSFIGAILFVLGTFLEKINIDYSELKRKPYLVIVSIALAWLIIPLISSIPYLLTGLSFIDSYFESMSAWTTTGFTMYQDITSLPNSIKFWRSFQQWLGGVGIVAFIVYLLKDNKILYQIVKIEREEFLEPTIEHTVKKVIKIYAILTFFGASLLSFSGLDFFSSINISMTALATGGMIPFNYLNLTDLQKVIIILLMLCGALSFGFHSKIFDGKFRFIKRYEPLYWIIALAVLISLINPFNILDSLFHAFSAITCTGFSYINLKNLNEGYIFGLIMLMLIGGTVGSTSGAIKIDRFIVLIKGVRKRIKELIYPEDTVIIEKYINEIIEYEDIYRAALYFFVYIIIFMISSILFSFYTHNFLHAMFEVVSAMGNVGLSLGYISQNIGLYKILFIILMWGGRIEFITAISFIYSIIRKWGM